MSKPTMVSTISSNESIKGFFHWCTGCNMAHRIVVRRNGEGPVWSFDYNFEAPTFGPSVNVNMGRSPGGGGFRFCHYYLERGKIRYLPDTWHYLSGKTVPLPAFPDNYLDEDEYADIVSWTE